jgi:magnesium transporter
MSEFSLLTQGIPWPVAYGAFVLVVGVIGWATYVALRRFDSRKTRKRPA